MSSAEDKLLGEAALGLKKNHGRRWAVAQSFVHGGTVDAILQRAESLNSARCAELGAVERDIWVDRRHLQSADAWYPRHFIKLGWSVRLANDVWFVQAPATASPP